MRSLVHFLTTATVLACSSDNGEATQPPIGADASVFDALVRSDASETNRDSGAADAAGNADGATPVGNFCAAYDAMPTPSGANVRFVSPTGDNAANGLSPATAWKNAANVSAGQILVFKGGTYSAFPVTAAGRNAAKTALTNVTFMAAPGEKPILTGGYAFITGYDDSVHDITIRGLTFTNYSARETGVVTFQDGSHHWTVECSTFKNIGTTFLDHAIYPGGGGAHHFIARGNRFENNSGGGIHSYHRDGLDNAEIYDNVFKQCKWGIIVSHEGQADWEIHHNSFYNTGAPSEVGIAASAYAAVAGGAPTSNVRIHHNAAWVKVGHGLRVDQAHANGIVNESDNVWGATGACPYSWGASNPDGPFPCQNAAAAASATSGHAQRNVFANPEWVNPDVGDFTRKPGGPAATLNAGARFQ
jgi:hypothetical protein